MVTTLSNFTNYLPHDFSNKSIGTDVGDTKEDKKTGADMNAA